MSRIGPALLTAAALLCLPAPSVAPAAVTDPTVMSRNLYLGADLAPIAAAAATGGDVGAASLTAFQNAVGTSPSDPRNNFHARALAIASEIAATHPDLVGLQEVTKFSVNGRTVLDYEPVLLAALAAHGQHYAAAIEQPEGDITRAIPGLGVTELQLSNIILARTDRADLVVGNPRGASFISQATFLGQPITRNWESVDARLGPTQFKFLNTSLEIGNDQTSTRQAAELIVGPLRSTAPVIAVGDLNSGPLSAQKGAYVLLTSPTAGNLRDAAAGAGLTCCRAELMSATEATDPKASLTERVDFVFTSPATVQAISALRTGIDQFLTPAGVPEFASDHTGVVATLRVP